MSLPLKRTLSDLRSDIQSRIGFAMAGQSGVVNSGLIDSMIRSAQNQLYAQFDWLHLKSVEEQVTGTDQSFYDYPVDCNIDRITGIWLVKTDGRYSPMHEGIPVTARGTPQSTEPVLYERRDQLEIFPASVSNDYKLRFEYIKVLPRLSVDTDRVVIDDELVYLHALSNAKAHYKQTDAQTYATQLEALLNKVKSRHRATTVYGKRPIIDNAHDYVTSDQAV